MSALRCACGASLEHAPQGVPVHCSHCDAVVTRPTPNAAAPVPDPAPEAIAHGTIDGPGWLAVALGAATLLGLLAPRVGAWILLAPPLFGWPALRAARVAERRAAEHALPTPWLADVARLLTTAGLALAVYLGLLRRGLFRW